jgi:hypothetical protein
MTSNIDIARKMAANGWPVVLANSPEGKTSRKLCPLCKGEKVYDFEKLFARAESDTNIGMHLGPVQGRPDICALDFDPDIYPCGVDLFQMILKEHPEFFIGCVIEETARGGIHVYFKRPPGVFETGIYIPIGVNTIYGAYVTLTSEHNTTCWPSRTSFGAYRVISQRTFVNTRADELPMLPEYFWPCNNRSRLVAVDVLDNVDGLNSLNGSPLFHDDPLGPDDSPAIIGALLYDFIHTKNGAMNNELAIRFASELSGYLHHGLVQLADVRESVDYLCSHIEWAGPHLKPCKIMRKGLERPAKSPHVYWPRIRYERWERNNVSTPTPEVIKPSYMYTDTVAVFLRDICKVGAAHPEPSTTTMKDIPAIQRILADSYVWACDFCEMDPKQAAVELARYGRGYGLGDKPLMELLYEYGRRCPWDTRSASPYQIIQEAKDNINTRSPRVPLSLIHAAYKTLPPWTPPQSHLSADGLTMVIG